MSFPTYAHYKDSGVEWLGEVPAHWETKRIKHLVRTFEQGWSPQCEGYPVESSEEWGVLKVGCVNGGTFRREENKALPVEIDPIPALGISAGDLLISRANTRELVGSAAVAEQDYSNLLLCDKLYRVRLKPQVCDPRFLGLYLGTEAARGQIELAATGASSSMVNIGQSTILEMQLSLPAHEEQLQIAAFLRRETTKLDALITEQRTLIDLLKEKRQAVISHAVTKGLDAGVAMKDSGVEWLGEVPAHWEIVQLKRAVVLQRGHDLPSEEREEGEIPIVSSGGVTGRHHQAQAKGPGIVTGRYGTIGQFTFVEEDYWPLNTTLYSVELFKNVPRFIWYMLQNISVLFLMNSGKSAVPGVDRNDLHPVPVVVPPVSEQKGIVDFLVLETTRLDALTAEAQTTIALLQERRSALISAAVTGKIDVRQAA